MRNVWAGLGVGMAVLCLACTRDPQAKQTRASPRPAPPTRDARAPRVPVAMAAGEGLGDVRIVVLAPNSASDPPPDAARAELNVATVPAERYGTYWVQGALFSTATGVKGTRFGQLHMNDGRLSFRQDGERWVAVGQDGTLYRDVAGTMVAFGRTASRSYRNASGEERHAIMSRRLDEGDRWCFEADGKVYQQGSDETVKQIGELEWRVVSPPNGEKLLVLMTRAMGSDARWQGRHGGTLYVERR
jgi:hypothetical protein